MLPPAAVNAIKARIPLVSGQAQNIFSITFMGVNLFQAVDEIWVARRQFALAQGNYQQVPSSPSALGRLLSAWWDYVVASVTNLPALWGNLVRNTVTTNPVVSAVIGILIVVSVVVAMSPPTPPNHPPQITSSPITQDTIGNVYQYQVTATDQDVGDVLIFSLPVKPAFLSIDSLTGFVQSDTFLTDTGFHQIRVKVTDTPGDSAIQDYQLLVLP
jgi:hypothetical protein